MTAGTWKPEHMVSESAEFIIGSSVSCRDGPCGELTRMVVDPAARTVTHLAVGPPHRGGTSRLVPVRLAGAGTAAIHLRCTMSQFEGLQEAEDTQIVPGALGELGDGHDHTLSAPYYGRGAWDWLWRLARAWARVQLPGASPLIASPQAKWKSAPGSMCMPRTAPSGRSGGWPSLPAGIM
jgi:hypothetical protein